MIDTKVVDDFLSAQRIAVVGASDEKTNCGRTVYCALRDHGNDVVAVNPNASTVAGDRCYPDVASVPEPLDGVVVMVGATAAVDVVRTCAERHVQRVWLFKGLGGPGAVSDEAVRLCTDKGIDVVAGACPLMFLEPVGWFHKIRRSMRRLSGSVPKAA